MSDSGLPSALVWGLLPRFVGLLYIVAFGALAPQMEVALCSRGAVPIAARLARIRRDYPGVRRFFEYPTLLWLNASDEFLRAIPWIGIACGACAIYGGLPGYGGLVFGWMLWLSCEPAGAVFPWDTLLQEVGFLVLFLPLSQSLPSLYASALPLPSVAFAFRWLVLRVMLGFGKVKFGNSSRRDLLYLRGFFVWMPLPSSLGWYAHHSPRWFLRAGLYFMFVGEVVAPWLGFFCGPLRLVSCGLLVALMAGIQMTGNWGYFNLAYILLCTCLLDTRSSIFDLGLEPWAGRALHWPDVAIHSVMGILFFSSLLYFVAFDSWVTRTWVHWPWDKLTWNRRWLRALLAFHRALAPFRLTSGYGVFPPNAAPPMRLAPVFEGSDDGVTWKSYGYRYLPSSAESRPRMVAPHHPRVDYMLHYAGAGIHDASLLTSSVGDGNPYASYTRSSWLDRMGQRLVQGDPLILRTLAHNPFPNAPPRLVRVSAMAMTPTRPSERRKTGKWWYTRRVGTLIRARGRENWPEALIMPEPEVFHPDWVDFKRRAPALRRIVTAHAAGVAASRAILEGSDLVPADVEQFWTELVPMIAEERGTWSRLGERAEAVLARFGVEQLYRLERVLERFAWLLRQSTERHFFADRQPRIAVKSNFRYHMLLHEMVIDGQNAYEDALRNPARAAARLEQSSDATQLWTLALLRYDMMLSLVRAFRWGEIGRRGHELGLPGLFEYYPLLVTHVPPEEDFCPQPIQHADGEYTIEAFYPPPPTTT